MCFPFVQFPIFYKHPPVKIFERRAGKWSHEDADAFGGDRTATAPADDVSGGMVAGAVGEDFQPDLGGESRKSRPAVFAGRPEAFEPGAVDQVSFSGSNGAIVSVAFSCCILPLRK